jgi:shikimate kinase
MIVIKNNQVYSSGGKYIHRKNSEVYYKFGTLLPTDTEDSFEEVDELPKYSDKEYREKVSELIHQRYSIDDEIALNANINRSSDYQAEYDEYQEFRTKCKELAKEILNNKE